MTLFIVRELPHFIFLQAGFLPVPQTRDLPGTTDGQNTTTYPPRPVKSPASDEPLGGPDVDRVLHVLLQGVAQAQGHAPSEQAEELDAQDRVPLQEPVELLLAQDHRRAVHLHEGCEGPLVLVKASSWPIIFPPTPTPQSFSLFRGWPSKNGSSKMTPIL